MTKSCGFPADLVTFTEEILNGQLHFLCSESIWQFVRNIQTGINQKFWQFTEAAVSTLYRFI